jgi:Tat protein translocase TatB subunit
MFGLGMGELLVILALALLFLGPKRLPDLASTLGKAIRSFRRATSDLQEQLEVDDSVKQPLRELKAALRDEPPPSQPIAVQVGPKLDQAHLTPPAAGDAGGATGTAPKPEAPPSPTTPSSTPEAGKA